MKPKTLHAPERLLRYPAFLITDIARLYRTNFSLLMKPLDLERSEWWLLTYLAYFNGESQLVLTELMDLTKGGMAKLIDRMTARGLVVREPSEEDRRSKHVHLTKAGWDLTRKVDAEGEKTAEHSLAAFTPAEIDTLTELLGKLRRSGFPDVVRDPDVLP